MSAQQCKFSCERCQYKTNDKSNFNKHIQAQHQNTEYSCDQCTRKFKSVSGRNNHNKTRHKGIRYECTESGCGKLYTQVKSLQNHVKSIHNGVLSSQEPITCFKCEYCNKYYKTQRLYHTCSKRPDTDLPKMTVVQGIESVEPTLIECNKRKRKIFGFQDVKDCFHDELEEEPAGESISSKVMKNTDEELDKKENTNEYQGGLLVNSSRSPAGCKVHIPVSTFYKSAKKR